MKKKIFAIILCALMLFAVLGACMLSAGAFSFDKPWDVGNYNDYGGGGGDGGGYSGGGYSGGGYSGGSSSRDGGFELGVIIGWLLRNPPALIAAIVIVLIIVALVAMAKKSGRLSAKGTPSVSQPIPQSRVPADNTGIISDAIRAIDPNFSSDAFITWSKDVFITLQQAWTARDWSTIRPLEKEELFEQHKRQLDEYINNKRINVIERINVGQTHLHKYERDKQYEYLTVYMATRMVDYIIDENTRKVLKGDPNTDCYMSYLLTFMRKTGTKSREGTDRTVSKSCPNCGAPLSITSSGKCEYCGSIITTGDFDWVLAKMDAVKPNTVIDNRGVIINDGSDDNGSDDSGNNDNGNGNNGNNGNGGNDGGNISFEDMMNGDNQ